MAEGALHACLILAEPETGFRQARATANGLRGQGRSASVEATLLAAAVLEEEGRIEVVARLTPVGCVEAGACSPAASASSVSHLVRHSEGSERWELWEMVRLCPCPRRRHRVEGWGCVRKGSEVTSVACDCLSTANRDQQASWFASPHPQDRSPLIQSGPASSPHRLVWGAKID